MKKEEMHFDQAMRELNQILERLANDDLDEAQLCELLDRGENLVKFCNEDMGKEEMHFDQAMRELNQILERLANDDLDEAQFCELLDRGEYLVKFCKEQLKEAEEAAKTLLSWKLPPC